MFEKIESLDIVIEMDYPKPAKEIRFQGRTDVWHKRLKPMKKLIGRRGRVMRGIESSHKASWNRQNIIRSLKGNDPYDRWLVEVGREDNQTWSIWVTYEGKMNEEEFAQDEREREERKAKGSQAAKDEALRRKLAVQARNAPVDRSPLSASLRPPTWNGD